MNITVTKSTLLAAALAAVLAACSPGTASEPATPAAPAIPVAAPLQQSIPITLDVPGHVEATERVELRTRLTGHIVRIAFSEGARVSRGQLLVQIDPAPYAAALASAEAQLRQADAEARLARAESARAARLAERQAISTEEAERREAQAAVAAARREGAAAAVQRARLDLDYTRITAPIDGRIGRAEATAGNLVGPQDRLATVVADDRVYVRFDVPETALAGSQVAAWRASFTLPEAPGHVFEGPLAFIENEINDGTGTVRARIALPGDAALLPGRYGQVRLELGRREGALLVDEKTIGADQGSRYVLVVGTDNTVQYRPVTTGPRVGDKRVIEQGLAADDRVVIAGLMGVRPGMTVAPQDRTPTASAATAAAVALNED